MECWGRSYKAIMAHGICVVSDIEAVKSGSYTVCFKSILKVFMYWVHRQTALV